MNNMYPYWSLALRGAFAILFGVLVLFLPSLSLTFLTFLYAGYSIASSVICFFILGFQPWDIEKFGQDWFSILFLGLILLIIGLICLFYPILAVLSLVIIMGITALFEGIFEIKFAFKHDKGWKLLLLSGVISFIFGSLVTLVPSLGVLALIWLIVFYAFSRGITLLSASIPALIKN